MPSKKRSLTPPTLDREAIMVDRATQVFDFFEGHEQAPHVVAARGRAASVRPQALPDAYSGYEKPARLMPGHDGKVQRFDPKGAIAKLENNAAYNGNYHNLNGIMYPEYNLLEAYTIYDTEAYVKQAITRRIALGRKAGWEIVSDSQTNKENVAYIRNRLSTMEFVMGQTTNSFFEDIWFNLLLSSNCFLWKQRDLAGSGGTKHERNKNRIPVAGYTLIPPHQILPYLKKGHIAWWRRFYDTGAPFLDIPLEDIIHLKWNVKPGHIFGTPRLTAVRNDIFALRRLEENIELLFINHLFPLFHVKVGVPDDPAFYGPNGESEIAMVKYAIENMPKEGVFVTDERVEVTSVGAQGQTLDTRELIAHLKNRIFTGMGMSALDMGEMSGTLATADNVSQNLKDIVKADLQEFSDMVRMTWFREWFLEAPYSLSVQDATRNVELRFHEIDLDNKIKWENHIIQQWLNNLIDEDEARSLLKRDPMSAAQEKKTHYWMHIRDLAIVTAKAKADFAAKASPGAGTSGNKARPTNQHGTNPGPTKAKSAQQHFTRILSDQLNDARSELLSQGKDFLARDGKGRTYWEVQASAAVDQAFSAFTEQYPESADANTYTNQLRKGLNRLKPMVGSIPDPEMLTILLDSGVGSLSEEYAEPQDPDPMEPESADLPEPE